MFRKTSEALNNIVTNDELRAGSGDGKGIHSFGVDKSVVDVRSLTVNVSVSVKRS